MKTLFMKTLLKTLKEPMLIIAFLWIVGMSAILAAAITLLADAWGLL